MTPTGHTGNGVSFKTQTWRTEDSRSPPCGMHFRMPCKGEDDMFNSPDDHWVMIGLVLTIVVGVALIYVALTMPAIWTATAYLLGFAFLAVVSVLGVWMVLDLIRTRRF